MINKLALYDVNPSSKDFEKAIFSSSSQFADSDFLSNFNYQTSSI